MRVGVFAQSGGASTIPTKVGEEGLAGGVVEGEELLEDSDGGTVVDDKEEGVSARGLEKKK